MKRLMCLLSCLFLLLTNTYAQSEKNTADSFDVYKGVYIVGKDIMPGSYILTLTECRQSTVVAIFDTDENLTSYTASASSSNLRAYGKKAVYVNKDIPVHITLEDGDRLYIGNGQGYITPSVQQTVMKGMYLAGFDIQPGAHILTLSDIQRSAVVATFSTSENMVAYVSWDSSDSLGKYGKTAMYVKSDAPVYVYLEEGEYLYVAEGNGTTSEYQEGTLVAGVYPIGKGLQPASYLITLNDISRVSIVATFTNSSDLISYTSCDSYNNLKKYSTSFISVKEGEQFHITLNEGEYLYISEGTGNYTIQ